MTFLVHYGIISHRLVSFTRFGRENATYVAYFRNNRANSVRLQVYNKFLLVANYHIKRSFIEPYDIADKYVKCDKIYSIAKGFWLAKQWCKKMQIGFLFSHRNQQMIRSIDDQVNSSDDRVKSIDDQVLFIKCISTSLLLYICSFSSRIVHTVMDQK